MILMFLLYRYLDPSRTAEVLNPFSPVVEEGHHVVLVGDLDCRSPPVDTWRSWRIVLMSGDAISRNL